MLMRLSDFKEYDIGGSGVVGGVVGRGGVGAVEEEPSVWEDRRGVIEEVRGEEGAGGGGV